jgi:hypothetical protein
MELRMLDQGTPESDRKNERRVYFIILLSSLLVAVLCWVAA